MDLDTTPLTVFVVTVSLAGVVYLLDSLYARRWLATRKEAIAYASAAVVIGVFGEVFVETIYNHFVGQPLWHYQFVPVHHTYTSLYSFILWALYGLHLYWVRETLDQKYGKLSRLKLATIFAIESLILETFANLVWLGVFGYLIYYYTPPDLWHVTTLVNIPCYFGASWAMISTVKRFRKDPRFFAILSIVVAVIFLAFP